MRFETSAYGQALVNPTLCQVSQAPAKRGNSTLAQLTDSALARPHAYRTVKLSGKLLWLLWLLRLHRLRPLMGLESTELEGAVQVQLCG